jgi:hypothetical protein
MQTRSILIAILALAPGYALSADPAEEASRRIRVWKRAQQTGICELHQTAMTKKTVPIIYGMRTWEGADPTTRLQLFPHAEEKYFGGCLVMAEKTRDLYICHDCQRAETAWNKANEGERVRGVIRSRTRMSSPAPSNCH